MKLVGFMALAALTLADPTGDAIGDGTLTAPTAPIYASSAIFDLHEVTVEADETGATVRVALGAIENASGLPEGFSGVVIDVYLDTGPGGADTTLTGPDMRMPDGLGWEYGVRISGDGAYAVAFAEADEEASAASAEEASTEPAEEASTASTEEASPESASAEPAEGQVSVGNAGATDDGGAAGAAGPDALGRMPLAIERDGSTLSVRLPGVVGERIDVYAMTGVYDPFTPSGWRPLSRTPSPWAFSGSDQVAPIVDLLAPDADAQERALRTGVLPRPDTRTGSTSWWLLLMALGVALAGAGLWFRRHVRPAAASVEAPGTQDVETPAVGDSARLEDEPSGGVMPSGPGRERDEGEPGGPTRDTDLVPEAPPERGAVTDESPAAVTDASPAMRVLDETPANAAHGEATGRADRELTTAEGRDTGPVAADSRGVEPADTVDTVAERAGTVDAGAERAAGTHRDGERRRLHVVLTEVEGAGDANGGAPALPRTETADADAAAIPESATPEGETPRDDAPKHDAPSAEARNDAARKDNARKDDAPKVESPKSEAPESESPNVESPEADPFASFLDEEDGDAHDDERERFGEFGTGSADRRD